MTRWVRMAVGISGGRHDGRAWPPAGGLVDVPDWEAEDLIRGGNAVAAEEPEPEPEPVPVWRDLVDTPRSDDSVAAVAPPYVSPLAEASRSDLSPARSPEDEHDRLEAVADGDLEPEPVPEAAEPATPPKPSDVKQTWIDWAVTQGADVHAAGAMSKIDLMSRYGGRL